MGYHREISQEETHRIQVLMKSIKEKEAFIRVQAVYLRAKYGLTPNQIADMTGYKKDTIYNIHASYFKDKKAFFQIKERGGRNNAYMSKKQESDFLNKFIEKSDKGGMLYISEVHKELCKKLNKNISLSSTYRLLHRHGWRKIMPRPKHPDTDINAQEEFKKNGK